jgi:hypothetical protein
MLAAATLNVERLVSENESSGYTRWEATGMNYEERFATFLIPGLTIGAFLGGRNQSEIALIGLGVFLLSFILWLIYEAYLDYCTKSRRKRKII